jgi:hypothetical protein
MTEKGRYDLHQDKHWQFKGRKNVIKELCITLFLLATAFVLCYPIIFKGYLTGADFRVHLLWNQQFSKSFHTGLLYPQWVSDVNLGCGSPSFIFYPPFTFFITGMLSFFTKEVLVLLNLSGFLGMFLSGITMYIFCRVYLTRPYALFSSIIYMGLPYHLFDLYTRSALAEFWAFVWFPLIGFFISKINGKTFLHCFGLSFAYTALLLTHLPMALLFTPFVFLQIIFIFFHEHEKKLLLYRLLAMFYGLGLSSLYLIPAIFEQPYVNINDHLNWYWVTFNNFLFSGNPIDQGQNRELSKIAIMTSLIAFISLFGWFYYKCQLRREATSYGMFFAVSSIASFLMMLPVSKILWEIFFLLKKVQFPWRLLSITNFYSSICAGFILEKYLTSSSSVHRWIRVSLRTILITLILISSYYSLSIIDSFENVSFDYVNLNKNDFAIKTDSPYDEMSKKYQYFSPNNFELLDVLDYRPVWSIRRSLPPGLSGEKLVEYEKYGPYIIFHPSQNFNHTGKTDMEVVIPYQMLKEYIVFQKGRGKLTIIQWAPETRVIQVLTLETSHLLLKTFYYPRWKAYLNKKWIPIAPDPYTGLIQMEIPKGEYILELRFEPGIYRWIGLFISATGLILMLCIIIKRKEVMSLLEK